MRTIELFAGIGGLQAACPWLDIRAAYDIDRDAQRVYSENFDSQYHCCELASVTLDRLAACNAEFWWMSPPCTPFTKKGVRKDHSDPRTAPLFHLIQLASRLRPTLIAIENVQGFEKSHSCEIVIATLLNSGYLYRICNRCPSQQQWPNRRPRVYLIAWTENLDRSLTDKIKNTWNDHSIPTNSTLSKPLEHFLDPSISKDSAPELWLDANTLQRYRRAIDQVDPSWPNATTACFASAYGKSITRSGSYLLQDDGCRRFSPREVASLLGFPSDFILPTSLPTRRLWQLLGNSLSLPVIRQLLSFTVPETQSASL